MHQGMETNRTVPAASLATFRIIFGVMGLFSTVRFLVLGWVEQQYVIPQWRFPYEGFEWVTEPSAPVLYAMFMVMGLAAIGVILGAFYRVSITTFFVVFTYIELLDKTFYLNHYYFVSSMAFLLIWLPLHAARSMDARWFPSVRRSTLPRWMLYALCTMVGLVYFYAGIAKINHDWLFEAMPLRLWLPAQDWIPVIGPLFREQWVAYAMSWAGMLFDVTIPFWLIWHRSRPFAYAAVTVFHGLTGLMFQIGVFPLVMIGMAAVFFVLGRPTERPRYALRLRDALRPLMHDPARAIVTAVLLFHIVFPWRYLLHDGDLFWTEAGYRFGWRVMLMEKAGTAQFFVRDGAQGRDGLVDNRMFLSDHQEKQMSMQPDIIVQYAHMLADHYRATGMRDPQVRADVIVTLNGRPGKPLVDPTVNLAAQPVHASSYSWVLQP
jgi:hypothetical protein